MATDRYLYAWIQRSALVLAATAMLSVSGALASEYPNRTVKFVVSLAPGGGVDTAGRILAAQLSKTLNQPFVVENKPGASGLLATQLVSTSKADGYTLLVTGTNLAIAPFMVEKNTLEVDRDLTPISLFGSIPYVMVVNKDIPATTPKELVEWIKANPGKFRWGTGSLGSPDHLALAQFNKMAGVKVTIVPYSGTGPAVVATLSGEVGGMISSPGPAKGNIESGNFRALGVTSASNFDLMPNLPTVASLGFPGFEALGWYAVLGPKDMPAELAAEINKHIRAAVNDPEVKAKLNAAGTSVAGTMTPEEFRTYLRTTMATYKGLIQDIELKH
jgi:tripartite-type tricarboxylate transporter receptor subunit TctC